MATMRLTRSYRSIKYYFAFAAVGARFAHPLSLDPDGCPTGSVDPTDCTRLFTVKNYDELRKYVSGARNGETLCFDPFNVDRDDGDKPLQLRDRRGLRIVCLKYGSCTLKGEGSHLRIEGGKSEVTIVGMKFVGSSDTSLKVRKDAGKDGGYEQKICYSWFIDNVSERRGGAINTDKHSRLLVKGTAFENNGSKQRGAGIYNDGTTRVIKSTFVENKSRFGAGIYSTEVGRLEVSDSFFDGNSVTGSGPCVYLEDGGFKDGGGNVGRGNHDEDDPKAGVCNGVLDEIKGQCLSFEVETDNGVGIEMFPTDPPSTPSPSSRPIQVSSRAPTQGPTPVSTPSPTKMPKRTPTLAPTSKPTKPPTRKPTSVPTPIPTPAPTIKPTSPPFTSPNDESISEIAFKSNPVPKKKPKGYFNFDPNDRKYGPEYWDVLDAKDTILYKNLRDYHQYFQPDMNKNYCGGAYGSGDRQSPIDLSRSVVNDECLEYHEIRDNPGTRRLDDPQIQKIIYPTHLSLEYPKGPIEADSAGQLSNPHADLPKAWGHFFSVKSIDVVIPSAHTLDGERFAAEYQAHVITNSKRGFGTISILIKEGAHNDHFQMAIDAWQDVYDRDLNACLSRRRRERKLGGARRNGGEDMISVERLERTLAHHNSTRGLSHRGGAAWNGQFDWLHSSIMTSIYFYGYKGSEIFPPCRPIVEWRVIDKPMEISALQLIQLKEILFTHVDEDCQPTSVHNDGVSVRPVQKNRGQSVHKCECIDFYSDRMRKKTGLRDCRPITLKRLQKKQQLG